MKRSGMYLQKRRNVNTPSIQVKRYYDATPTATMGAAAFYDKVATYEKD